MWGILGIILLLFIIIIIYLKYLDNSNSRYLETFINIPDDNLYIPVQKDKPTEIKYQIPISQNQLTDTQLQSIDSDILRNVRYNKIFSNIDELDFYQFYNLLKNFKNQQYNFTFNLDNIQNKSYILPSEKIIELNSGAINNTNLELFYRLKLELISSLNNLVIKNGYYLPYHKYQFFKIINSNLISRTPITNKLNTNIQNNNLIDNDLLGNSKYIFTLTIAREFKFQQFILYYDIDLYRISPTNYTAIINKLEIIGIPIPKTIEFHENRKTTDIDVTNTNNIDIFKTIKKIENQQKDIERQDEIFKDQVIDSQNFDVQPIGDGKLFQSPETKFIDLTEISDLDPTLFDSNSQNSFIEDKRMNIARDQQFHNHRCYGLVNGKSKELVSYNDNPLYCKSYHPEVGQNGIWDAPCQINTDCPFYKANRNYPNQFGKCNKESGYCEMPLGIIPIGFTKYAKIQPKCYNCEHNSTDSRCCQTQAENIIKGTVKFNTPDYIFKGDSQLRKQYKDSLENIGLHANPSI